MGANWYYPFTVYGCAVKRNGASYNKTLRRLTAAIKDHRKDHQECFEVFGILSEFHSRMDDSERNDMTERAQIVLGFRPSSDMQKNTRFAEALKDFVKSLGDDWELEEPQFHAGIEWYDYDNDSEESDDEEEPELPTFAPAKTLTAEEIHAMFY